MSTHATARLHIPRKTKKKSTFEEETKLSFNLHIAQDSLELTIADLEFNARNKSL